MVSVSSSRPPSPPVLPYHQMKRKPSHAGPSSPTLGWASSSLRSTRPLHLLLLAVIVLLLLGYSQRSRNALKHARLTGTFLDDIGVPVGFNVDGSFGIIDPSRRPKPVIPAKPRDPLIDGLSVLGLEADATYHLGDTNPDAYLATLRTFIEDSFPAHLQPELLASLDTYWKGGDGLPAVVDSKTIWQTAKEKAGDKSEGQWQTKNEDWAWKLLDDADADAWIKEKLGSESSLLQEGWDHLELGILKADALRYLLLLLEGGVYTDTDTICLKPISLWGQHPRDWEGQQTFSRESKPSVIIGIEADVGDRVDWNSWWPRPLQLTQWTLASAPGHPIFLDVVRRILLASTQAANWRSRQAERVRELEVAGDQEAAKRVREASVIKWKGGDGLEEGVSVMDWTGPGVWTDAVFSYLMARHNLTWPALKDLREPLRIGEITILPVTGFSPGVGLFNAGGMWDDQAMVQHDFAGRWKEESG